MLPLPTSTRFAETGLASSSGRLFRVQHFASTSIASHVVVTRVGIVMDVRDFAIAKTLARSICRELVQVALMVATQLQGSASGTFRFRWSAASARFSLVRYRTVPECAFPSRRGAREVWGNPPPGCGAGCAGVRRSRFGVWSHGKVHSAQPVGCRMRFSVRPPTQSALFREAAHPECAFP